MSRRLFSFPLVAITALVVSCTPSTEYDVILRNGTLFDGTGAPGVVGDVAIQGDRIAAVAYQIFEDREGERTALLAFVLQNDLGEGDRGQILTALVVHDLDLVSLTDERGDVLQRDVAAAGGVVELSICVTLY